MFSNILLGAAGFPVADLGDEISQSLRFGGVSGQKLIGSSAIAVDDTYTLSFWYKHTHNTTRYRGSIFTNNGDYPYLSFNANNGGYSGIEVYNGSAYVLYPPNSVGSFRELRDPSAWLHCVIAQVNSTSFTIYINGEQAYQTTSQQCDWTNFTLGGHLTSQHICDGMIAQLYHIDGTALTPSSFGKTNDDGVWVPQDYTGSYGTNGFHLKFDSSGYNGSGGIGADHSGNGNDFTASGFDTGNIVLYSQDVFGDNSSTYDSSNTNKIFLGANFGPDKMFNGVLNDDGCKSGTGSAQTWIYWRPSGGLSISSSLTVTCSNTGAIRVNGTDQGLSNSGTSTLTISNPPATLTELAVQGNSISSATVMGVTVDGTTLVDNTDNDVDFLDTPTSNYATSNPLNYSLANLSGANLNIRGSGSSHWQFRPGTVPSSSGKWYWEALAVGSGSSLFAGIVTDEFAAMNVSDVYMGQASGAGTGGWSLYGSNGTLYRNGVDQVASEGTPYTGGDILMFALDLENGAWWAGQNGTWYQSATTAEIEAGTTTNALDTGTLSGTFMPGFQTQGSSSNGWDINFGQMPFIYTQPSGFNAWQTNNLPEPTIKNGSDHFRALTGTGANILAIAQGTNTNGTNWNPDVDTGFTNGLWWIKDRDNSNQHQFVDSLRGSNTAFPNPSEGTETTYSAPSGSSVAWCWDAGSSFTPSQTGGLTNLSGLSNTESGFSIITYTGSGSNSTFGHGLTAAPEFYMVRKRSGGPCCVFHESSGGGKILVLNTTAAAANASTYWNSTAPTDSVINLGTSTDINASGSNFIVYAWHSVEGFSKFGSYTGNGDTSGNGPFIYTGFRPAFVMMKAAVGATGSWMILDSTRSPSNPSQAQLRADLTTGEVSNAAYDVDFLSNGFKPRYYYSNNNSSGVTYIYVAFAENPFGGENAAPATAR